MMKTTSIVCLILGVLLIVFGVTAVIFSQTSLLSGQQVYESFNGPMTVRFSVNSSMVHPQRAQSAQSLAVIGTGSAVGGILFLFMSLYASVEQRKLEMREKMHRIRCTSKESVQATPVWEEKTEKSRSGKGVDTAASETDAEALNGEVENPGAGI